MIGPKCQRCKRQRKDHFPGHLFCPVGRKTIAEYDRDSVFQAKEPKPRGGSEKRKDRGVRRAVKSQPCCACGTKGTDWNPVDPAHVKTFKVSQSDHPANLIPLCRTCHSLQHAEGWGYFLSLYGHVGALLLQMGWSITPDPFGTVKVYLEHPEVA